MLRGGECRGGSCYAMSTLLQCHVCAGCLPLSALLSFSNATRQVHSQREEEASAAAFLLLAMDHHIVSCRSRRSACVPCNLSTVALRQPHGLSPAIKQQPQKTAQQQRETPLQLIPDISDSADIATLKQTSFSWLAVMLQCI